MENKKIQSICNLTSTQNGILFHSLKSEIQGTYVEQIVFHIKGQIIISYLEKALEDLSLQYEALRSNILYKKLNIPRRVVYQDRKIPLCVHGLQEVDILDHSEKSREIIKSEKQKICDISEDSLFRVCIIINEENKFQIVFTYHHVILDGWSTMILLNTLLHTYLAKISNTECNMQKEISYSDYVEWIDTLDVKNSLNYWENYLKSYEDNMFNSAYVFQKNKGNVDNTAEIEAVINAEDWGLICKSVNNQKCTINSYLKVIFSVILQQFVLSEDLVFGEVTSGREISFKNANKIVGLLINTIPVRVKGIKETLLERMISLNNESVVSRENAHVGLDRIKKLQNSDTDLIKFLYVFENYPTASMPVDSYFKVETQELFEQTNYDFNLILTPRSDGLVVRLIYNGNVYTNFQINQFLECFVSMCIKGLSNFNTCINELDIRQCALDEAITKNNKKNWHKNYNTLATLSKGDKVAVVDNERSITYSQLDKMAENICKAIYKDDNSAIAIVIERSVDFIVSVLAVVKSGRPFVCIDPKGPQDRISYILNDCGCSDVLYNQMTDRLAYVLEKNTEILAIDINNVSHFNNRETSYIQPIDEDSPLYIVYTSGTSGKPKGVIVPYRTINNLIYHQNYKDDLILNGTVSQYANSEFDVCYQEIFATLNDGGTLVILDERTKKDPEALMAKVAEHGIDTLFFPTAFFNQLSTNDSYLNLIPKNVKNIVVAGEQLSISKALANYLKNSDIRLHNHYGPSETHVISTKIFDCKNISEGLAPIGCAIVNNRILIEGLGKTLQPDGFPGEIIAKGVNVGLGYCSDAGLTNKKFIRSDSMKYFTGDYGVFDEKRELYYICRKDSQVKVRGYRVELSEIQETAKLYQYVLNSIAIVSLAQKLVLFIVIANNMFDLEKFKIFIKNLLPEYMTPEMILVVDNIPTTERGKVDYSELENIISKSYLQIEDTTNYLLSEKEKILLDIWQQLLSCKIDIDTNFFKAGGDSIKALQMSSRLMKFDYDVKINDLYQCPTIRSLSKRVFPRAMYSSNVSFDEFNLTPIQKYFFSMRHINPNRWNQSIALYSKDKLDYKYLNECIRYIYNYHDALRLKFVKQNGIIMQRYSEDEAPQDILKYRDVPHGDEMDVINREADKEQSTLNIYNAPLCKFILYHTNKGDYLVCIAHHLIVDAVSWRIIIEDLYQLYMQKINNQPMKLQGKTLSFQDFSKLQYEVDFQDDYFWRNQQWNDTLITRYDGIENNVEDSKLVETSLSRDETNLFLKGANAAYETNFNELLLTALAITINREYSISNKMILLEGHGRLNNVLGREINLSRTVGWFTCMYPICLKIQQEDNIEGQIYSTKQSLSNIPNQGIGYGIYSYLKEEGGLQDLNSAEISFNYLGQFDNYNNSMFKWSDCDLGSMTQKGNKRIAPICITGLIDDNKLKIYIDYNKKMYLEDSMESLIKCFKQSLLDVIYHCESKISKVEVDDESKAFSLSLQQSEIYTQYLLSPDNTNYLVQYILTMQGRFTLDCMSYCLNQLMHKHIMLRISIYKDLHGEIKQKVQDKFNLPISYFDFTKFTDVEQEARINEIVLKDKTLQFDLENGLPLRLCVIITGEKTARLIWSFHHISIDGWSIQVLLKDWHQFYNEYWAGKSYQALEDKGYYNYIKQEKSINRYKAKEFWFTLLDKYSAKEVLPINSTIKDKGNEAVHFSLLDSLIHHKCNEFAQQRNISINIVYESVWGILLQMIGYTDDIVYHVVHAGRPHSFEGIESTVGYFIKTIPIRTTKAKDKTFIECTKNLYDIYKQINNVIGETSYDIVPMYATLPLNLFIFENYPETIIHDSDFIVNNAEVYSPIPADIFLMIIQKSDTVKIELHYKENVCENDIAQEILNQYILLLENLINNPNKLILQIHQELMLRNVNQDFEFDF